MSTRAGLAVKFDDGVHFTMVSSDGYPRYLGNLLVNVYSSDEQAKAVSNLGDLRTLGLVLERDSAYMEKPCDLCGGMFGAVGTECWIRDYGYSGDEYGPQVIPIDKWQFKSVAMHLRDFAVDCDYVYYWDGKEWRIFYNDTFVKLANSKHLKVE